MLFTIPEIYLRRFDMACATKKKTTKKKAPAKKKTAKK